MRNDGKWSNAMIIDHASQTIGRKKSIVNSFYTSGMYLLSNLNGLMDIWIDTNIGMQRMEWYMIRNEKWTFQLE